MSILFLDFDGVLNSTVFTKSVFTDNFFVRQENEDPVEFDKKRLDPKAIQLLNQIVEATRCTIIVSSAWRVGSNRHYLHWLLVSLGFKGYIWGCTPHLPGENRSKEIKEALKWLKAEGFDTSRYAILDDVNIYDHKGHFIEVSEHTGLTEADVAKAIDILGPYAPSS